MIPKDSDRPVHYKWPANSRNDCWEGNSLSERSRLYSTRFKPSRGMHCHCNGWMMSTPAKLMQGVHMWAELHSIHALSINIDFNSQHVFLVKDMHCSSDLYGMQEAHTVLQFPGIGYEEITAANKIQEFKKANKSSTTECLIQAYFLNACSRRSKKIAEHILSSKVNKEKAPEDQT